MTAPLFSESAFCNLPRQLYLRECCSSYPICLCRCTYFHKVLSYQVHELESLEKFAVAVLQPVSFVDHHAAPVDLLQLRAVRHNHLKCGDHAVELKIARYRVSLQKGKQKDLLSLYITSTHGHD